MANGDLNLPDGLKLKGMDPQWLTNLWPMNELDSSIGSIITTLSIYAGLFAGALILAYVAKSFLPRVLNKIVSTLLILGAVGVAVSAGFAFATWSQPDAVSDHALGVEVAKTTQWLSTQHVSMDNAQTWNLLCFYYEAKNANCKGTSPIAISKGQKIQVHLEKNADGSFYLYDFKNKIPLNS